MLREELNVFPEIKLLLIWKKCNVHNLFVSSYSYMMGGVSFRLKSLKTFGSFNQTHQAQQTAFGNGDETREEPTWSWSLVRTDHR